MAQVKLTLNGITMSVDAKAVPALLLALSGKSAPVKSYIGEKEIAEIKASTPEELVLATLKMAKEKFSQARVHVKYTGLNDAIRKRFSKDPITVTTDMEKKGLIKIESAKGGKALVLPVVADPKK